MHVHIRNYANFIIYMCVCVYIYSNGNVLPSILVPVYVLYIFCYHTLLYGGNKEIYLSIYLLVFGAVSAPQYVEPLLVLKAELSDTEPVCCSSSIAVLICVCFVSMI